MIKISVGDTVKCLTCKLPIQLNNSTYIHDNTGKYIYCKNCKACYGLQEYQLQGEKVQ